MIASSQYIGAKVFSGYTDCWLSLKSKKTNISTIFTSSHTWPLHNRAHEQKAQYAALLIGMATVANKKALFVTFVDRVPRFKAY